MRNWMRLLEQKRSFRQLVKEANGTAQSERDALELALSELVPHVGPAGQHPINYVFDPHTEPFYAKGWWPGERLVHHMGLQGTVPLYNTDQLRRAYRKLSKEDQVAWWIELQCENAWIEREQRFRRNRWRATVEELEVAHNALATLVQELVG